MPSKHHQLSPEAFERLREQLATAAALCSDSQLLTLADSLHDALRRRRDHRRQSELRSWDPPGARMNLATTSPRRPPEADHRLSSPD